MTSQATRAPGRHARPRALTILAALAFAIAAQEVHAEDAKAPTAIAEQPVLPDRPLTLEDCVAVALAFSPRLVAANAEVREARALLTRARGADDPRVSLTAGASVLEKEPSLTVPGMGTLTWGSRLNWEVGLRVRTPIFTSGRLGALRDQAEALVDAAAARGARERQAVARDAVVAYFGVLKARGMLAVAEEQASSLSAQHDAVLKMHEVGLVPKLDPARSAVALASAQEALMRARNAEQVALAALRAVLGVPEGASLEVTGEYEQPDLPADLDSALAEAKANRPEVAMMAAYHRAAEASLDIAAAGNDPQLGLLAQWEPGRPSPMPDTGRWSLGLGLTWDIMDGHEARSGKDQARARIEKVEAETRSLADAIVLQVTEAFLNYGSADARTATMRAALASADEAVELAAVGYANAITPLTDLLAAQAARAAARNDHVTAEYDRRMAMTELLFALGR